jgi:Peroxide stress protein YaaA
VISVHAKRARGLMVRNIAERNISTLDEVIQFNMEGYQYIPERSNPKNNNNNNNINTLVFNRSKQVAVAKVDASESLLDTNHTTTSTSGNNLNKRARKL